MSAIQPIPQIAEKYGEVVPFVVAAYRPEANGFGRRTGWIKATADNATHVSRTGLKVLKDQGFTKVKVSTHGIDYQFTIEELLNA